MLLTLSKMLAAEMETLFKTMQFMDKSGELRAASIYRQRAPKPPKLERAAAEVELIPFIMVIWDSIEDIADKKLGDVTVATFLLDFAVYDNGESKDGADQIMLMTDRVYNRFQRDRWLGDFMQYGKIKAAPQAEDTKSYYTGGMALQFVCPKFAEEGSRYT